MADINNDNFIVPYPPEYVYGLGIVGPSSQTEGETTEEKNVEEISNKSSNPASESAENINKEGNEITTEANKLKNAYNGINDFNEVINNPIASNSSNSIEDYLGKNIDTSA